MSETHKCYWTKQNTIPNVHRCKDLPVIWELKPIQNTYISIKLHQYSILWKWTRWQIKWRGTGNIHCFTISFRSNILNRKTINYFIIKFVYFIISVKFEFQFPPAPNLYNLSRHFTAASANKTMCIDVIELFTFLE